MLNDYAYLKQIARQYDGVVLRDIQDPKVRETVYLLMQGQYLGVGQDGKLYLTSK